MALSARTAEVSLRPSPLVVLANVLLHALALVALQASRVPAELASAVSLALCISLLHVVHYLLATAPVHVAYLNGIFTLRFRDGQSTSAWPSPPIVLLSELVVMNFVDGSGRHFPLVLTRDVIEPDQFRRFRVLLNLRGSALFSRSVAG